MSKNNYITIKKFDIAKLSNNQVTDLVGAINEIKTIESNAKAKLIASGLTECEGQYYKVKITPAHSPIVKREISINWEKVIAYLKANNIEIPMTIDYDKLATMQEVMDIANKNEFYDIVTITGKAYTGAVKVTKKEGN